MPTESAIDSILVKYAGIKSPEEIADETGLDAPEVARRTQEIMDRVMLSPEQLVAKNIYQLMEISNKQFERFAGAKDEDVARLGNTAAGSIGRIQLATEKLLALQQKDHTERDEAYGRALATLVDKAMQRAIGELKVRHPEIDAGQLATVVESHLVEIALEMDSE